MSIDIDGLKNYKRGIMPFLVIVGLVYSFYFPQYAWGYFGASEMIAVDKQFSVLLPIENENPTADLQEYLIFIQGHTLVQIGNPDSSIARKTGPTCPATKNKWVVITAYSSTPEETDNSPFITASGSMVRDGIIAANFLKFGTKVKIPRLYGDKIFVVEDRMASWNSNKVDIWMPSQSAALQFGVKRAEIVILEI